MSRDRSIQALLVTLAEPTRLRILNCLGVAPLFVSDLQAILGLPQPTVSRHLKVLRDTGVVRDTPVSPFVLYRLYRDTGPRGRLVHAILDAIEHDEPMKVERHRAARRSRANIRDRTPRRESAPA